MTQLQDSVFSCAKSRQYCRSMFAQFLPALRCFTTSVTTSPPFFKAFTCKKVKTIKSYINKKEREDRNIMI